MHIYTNNIYIYIYLCIDIVSLVCTSHAVPFRPWRQGELGPTGFPRGPRLRGILRWSVSENEGKITRKKWEFLQVRDAQNHGRN